jgi:hypothetical protein
MVEPTHYPLAPPMPARPGLITDSDGTVHFSSLKQMARSALHYKYACEHQTEPSAAMRLGTIVNYRVLGKAPRREIVVYEGERRGRAWQEYKAEHDGAEIVTVAEWDDAGGIVEAVAADDRAQRLIRAARYEVPLKWADGDLPCSTSGIDIVGHYYIADLKVVHNAEPEYLQKHAVRMWWHAQLAWYRTGLLSGTAESGPFNIHKNEYGVGECGFTARPRSYDLYLLCVESHPPHCVTVLQMTPELIEHAEKTLTRWKEQLRVCASSGHYPGYTQAVVPWGLPEWMWEGEDE